MYDVVIIGAGPSGLFAAYELISNNKNLKIAILDEGKKADKRFCPMNEKKIKCQNCKPCNILSGYGGAGTFSDGKLNFIPKLGKSDLYKYMSISEAEKLIDYTEEVFTKFKMDSDVYPTNMDEALAIKEKIAKAGANLLIIKQKHLGSDKLPKYIEDFTTYLENHITKEQNQVLQSVPGFRVKYITMLSVLTEIMERNYHWANNQTYKSNYYDLIPDTFKAYYTETFATRYKLYFHIQFMKFSSEWIYKYTSIINEGLFDFIKTNDYADFYNIEYLIKMIENILKIAKFRIYDF